MDKYIIFLPDEIVGIKKCLFGFSKYNKLLKGLKKYGIKYIYESEISTWNSENFTFDYEKDPELNKLYIHLCGTLYFSDNNYSRYRMNLEKELLLLLSGYLGAKEINIIDNKIINTEKKVSSSINVEGGTNSVEIGNTNTNSQKISIKETYSLENENLLFVESIDEFKKIFFEKINRINQNYSEYFKICSKLILFTSKRFDLRMLSYSYNLEQEYKNEKIIQVKTLLYTYGIGLQYKSNLEINLTQMYEVIFFNNDELLFYHLRNEKMHNDIFCRLRNDYAINKRIMIRDFDENWGGYPNYIFDKVIQYSKDKGLFEKLDNWFKDNVDNRGVLLGDCHNIKDEIDVKEWFKKKFNDIDL